MSDQETEFNDVMQDEQKELSPEVQEEEVNEEHEHNDEQEQQQQPAAEEQEYEAQHNESDVPDEDRDLDLSDLSKLKVSKRKNFTPQPSQPRPQSQTLNRAESGSMEAEHHTSESFSESSKRRQALEAKFERALKRPKVKRRKDEHDLTNDEDEYIQILKREMDEAAKMDAELIENQSGIAVNKVKLLPKVVNILNKVNLFEVILDNNLLAEIRQWLEPLPDGSLPSYEIQKVMFQSLLKLPINTNHLRESGIGKILIFYQKSKRVEPKIKRVADKLISDWTRPIIGASDNYRDKHFSTIDFDSLKLKRSKISKPIAPQEKTIYEQQAERRNRAAAPAPTVSDYKFAPKSKVDTNQMNSILNAGVGSSLNRDEQFKRINNKLHGRKTSTKKGGISVEGRGMGSL